jgi:hypothetical protein
MNAPDILGFRSMTAVGLLIAAAVSMTTSAALGQPAPSDTTSLLVTTYRLKPDRVTEWLALQKSEVVPALKQAGVIEYAVYETLLGEASEFVVVRAIDGFVEFDRPDPLVRALGAEKAAEVGARLRQATLSIHRHIEERQDEFFIDPGAAPALFASRYRANPGRSQDYMSFVRTEMFPVMRQAKEDGTFSGLSVTVAAHGGESGLITLNMYYPAFAPLDGPPPVAKTLGPEGTREFIAKGAGLITPLEWTIRRRVPDLSF